MCGIFGALGYELAQPALESVFRVLHHRGPDGRGLYVDAQSKLTFAHTRLAVIDLETGAQPIESDDGNVILAANGEIYDFERIRSSLEAKGHRFKTKSDSEIIIGLYREYGLGLFEHLRGEFAFLLYDRARRLLIAARDRFGIKPLYFSRLLDGFVFASEMKAIFASGLLAPKLDVAAFDPLLDQDPRNMRFPFEGIEHVPPASYAVVDVDTNELRIVPYWSAEIPAQTANPVTEPLGDGPAKAAQVVLEQAEEAVRTRLRADVPVGLYLSGGIDSAFVGALMTRNLKSKLHSFSIAFEGSVRNEQLFARTAADFLGTVHHELVVTKQMLWNDLERCVWFSELPFMTLAPVGKFLLSEEARKSVTVVLTGEGADEVFLGYRSIFQKALRDSRGARSRNPSAQLRRLKLPRFAAAAVHKLSMLMFRQDKRSAIAAARAQTHATDPSKPLINAVQEARIAGMPLDILCYLGDREEMAHSLEARLPFLDHHLYDAAKFIPADFKLRDGIEKAVLRDAAEGILPEKLRFRRKRGFMLSSDAVDLFGADRELTNQLRRRYLSKRAFEDSRVFSYGAYRTLRLLAMIPGGPRRNANKVMLYMMQTHMLHDMFIADPLWNNGHSAASPANADRIAEPVS